MCLLKRLFIYYATESHDKREDWYVREFNYTVLYCGRRLSN